MTSTLPLSALLCAGALLFPLAASASDWGDALHAELEAGEHERALDLYGRLAGGGGLQAMEAAYRRIVVLARLDKPDAVAEAARAFREKYPDATYSEALASTAEDPAAFVARHRGGDPDAEILRRLEEQRVTLNFADTPFEDVIAFLQDITGLNVVLLPGAGADATVNLRLRDIALKNALNLILGQQELGWRVACRAVVIGRDPASVQALRFDREAVNAYPTGYEVLKTRTVTLNFPGTPFEEVLGFLQDITGTNIVLLAPEAAERACTLRIRDMPLDAALTHILAQVGLRCELRDEAIVLERAESR